MNKLQAHFKKMQKMAERYLLPEAYVDRDGKRSDSIEGEKLGVRNDLLVGDMIYMLDGPEQRAAEAEVDREREDMLIMIKDLMRVLHIVDHVVTIDTPDGKRTIVASHLIS